MSDTPLLESAMSVLLTLQPVFSSNGGTQSYAGSTVPRSVYPAHVTRLSAPSPGPIDCWGLGAADPLAPPLQAAARSATTPASARILGCFMRCVPPPMLHRRRRRAGSVAVSR